MRQLPYFAQKATPLVFIAEQIKQETKVLITDNFNCNDQDIENNTGKPIFCVLAQLYHQGTLSQACINEYVKFYQTVKDDDGNSVGYFYKLLKLAAEKNLNGIFMLITTAMRQFFFAAVSTEDDPVSMPVAVHTVYHAKKNHNPVLLSFIQDNFHYDHDFQNTLFLFAAYHADLDVMNDALINGANIQEVTKDKISTYWSGFPENYLVLEKNCNALDAMLSNTSLIPSVRLRVAKFLVNNGFDVSLSLAVFRSDGSKKKSIVSAVLYFADHYHPEWKLRECLELIDYLFHKAKLTSEQIKQMVNGPVDYGRTPLQTAITILGQEHYNHCHPYYTKRNPLVIDDDPTVVAWFIQHGVDLAREHQTQAFWHTSLHYAAREDLYQVIKLLCRHGADMKAQLSEHNTLNAANRALIKQDHWSRHPDTIARAQAKLAAFQPDVDAYLQSLPPSSQKLVGSENRHNQTAITVLVTGDEDHASRPRSFSLLSRLRQFAQAVPRRRHLLETGTGEERRSLLHSNHTTATVSATTSRRDRSDDDDNDNYQGTALRPLQATAHANTSHSFSSATSGSSALSASTSSNSSAKR